MAKYFEGHQGVGRCLTLSKHGQSRSVGPRSWGYTGVNVGYLQRVDRGGHLAHLHMHTVKIHNHKRSLQTLKA